MRRQDKEKSREAPVRGQGYRGLARPEEQRDFAVKGGLKPPRLISCPNLWCNQSWYHEVTDDLGRVEGYCEACGLERPKAKLGG